MWSRPGSAPRRPAEQLHPAGRAQAASSNSSRPKAPQPNRRDRASAAGTTESIQHCRPWRRKGNTRVSRSPRQHNAPSRDAGRRALDRVERHILRAASRLAVERAPAGARNGKEGEGKSEPEVPWRDRDALFGVRGRSKAASSAEQSQPGTWPSWASRRSWSGIRATPRGVARGGSTPPGGGLVPCATRRRPCSSARRSSAIGHRPGRRPGPVWWRGSRGPADQYRRLGHRPGRA